MNTTPPPAPKSACCRAPISIWRGSPRSNYQVCEKCQSPCDAEAPPASEKAEQTWEGPNGTIGRAVMSQPTPQPTPSAEELAQWHDCIIDSTDAMTVTRHRQTATELRRLAAENAALKARNDAAYLVLEGYVDGAPDAGAIARLANEATLKLRPPYYAPAPPADATAGADVDHAEILRDMASYPLRIFRVRPETSEDDLDLYIAKLRAAADELERVSAATKELREERDKATAGAFALSMNLTASTALVEKLRAALMKLGAEASEADWKIIRQALADSQPAGVTATVTPADTQGGDGK